MSEEGSRTHAPGGLLAALVPSGVLRQPEVALTSGIWWVLGMDGAAGALDALIAREGIEPEANGTWYTEVVGADGGRSDLEYRWGSPALTRVLVEAKIGHTLTPEQVAGYASRLPESGGLLVVLTPAARRAEAREVVARCAEMVGDSVRLATWTYDDVLAVLERALPSNADLAQLAGLVRAHNATDVEPLASDELREGCTARRDDIWWIVDHASLGIHGSRYPSGSDGTFLHRRYLPVGPYAVALAVGVGRTGMPPDPERPWAWLRLSGSDGYARIAHRALAMLRPEVTRAGDDSWLALPIETGVHGSRAAERLRIELESTIDQLVPAMATEVERELAGLEHLQSAPAQAVLGVTPLTPADLLAATTRQEDLWVILTEAVRPLYQGRIFPTLTNDPDYERVRYVPVPASDSYLAVCLRRTDGELSAPAAWVRVHRATRHSELGRQALDDVSPGQVVEDPHGWAVPVSLSTGAEGPAVLAAAHEQIRALVNTFAQLIANR